MARLKRAPALLIGTVLAGGVIGWFSAAPAPADDTPAPIDRAAAVASPVPNAPPSTIARAQPGSPAPTAAANEVLDLCGIGRMPVPVGTPADPPPAWQDLPTPLGAPAMAAARAQLMARLAAGNDRQRAAALMLSLQHAEEAEERAELAAQVAAIERTARDPALSAWSMAICDVSPSACDADTARRWVDLERDNAAAWLALSRRQPAATEEVVHGLAQAVRHEVHFGALAATVQKAWPEGQSSYLQLPILLHAVGVDGMVATNLIQRALHFCKTPPGESPRAAACDALAEALVQRGDTVLSHKIGAAIGAGLGWPAERVAALNAESKALIAAGSGIHVIRQPYSCENIERVHDWLDAVARSGEKAVARATLRAQRPAGAP